MSMQSELERYLAHFRQRLAVLIAARAAAALALGALVLTLVAVYFATRRAFDPDFVLGARLVLLLGLGALGAFLWWKPLRLLKRNRGVPDIAGRRARSSACSRKTRSG
jgi:hypothetical protein